jgi:hypothetical protein
MGTISGSRGGVGSEKSGSMNSGADSDSCHTNGETGYITRRTSTEPITAKAQDRADDGR